MTALVHARCEQAWPEAGGVKVFTLRAGAEQWGLQPPAPGGHIAIEYPDIRGIAQQRFYSVVRKSAPDLFEIAVKRTGNQGVSDSLHATLTEGAILPIRYASGHITVAAIAHRQSVLMLAGGIGLTLPIALIRELGKLDDAGQPVPNVHLYLCSTTIGDVPFLHELLALDLRSSWFKVRIFVTRDEISSRAPHFVQGRPTEQDLRGFGSPDAVVICGGHSFASTLQQTVKRIHPAAEILVESFTPPAAKAEPIVLDGKLATGGRLLIPSLDRAISVNTHKSILDQLEENQISIKSQCRSGICGSCRIKILAGGCRREIDFALSDADRSSGYALACCTYPAQEELTISL
ncbi:NADH oxidoreductase HCR [Andreprevotia sp. IGB-42]|uniref:iron-sulfur cluster-binding domain-containing protein n=1 Tax=Andreprevotia sp. IGB-42 TaxID=2497473 RepID=UPI00135BCEE0|nr:iron-sulfur cluster-binding domain-containing protein [Andreprevotia sp. IGB-42]KAF0814869.1 NADH oxidoreductase HCR [Andreprevotia sp. IGB-42]